MKNLSVCIGMVMLSVGMSFHSQAQMLSGTDSIKVQLDRLIVSKNTTDRQTLNARLKLLAASNTETDMAIAGSYYFQLKNTRLSDSVFTAEVIKFPKGLQARIKAQQTITAMKSLSEMEKAYNTFIKSFPPDSYPKLPFGEDRLTYDRIRLGLAKRYAQDKNIAKANYYASLFDADFWRVRSYSELSEIFYTNGDLQNAALYQKKAVVSSEPFINGKLGNTPTTNFAAKGYADACRVYAQILYEQKKYNTALTYIEKAVNTAKVLRPEYNYTYAQILAALNRDQEAYNRIEAAITSGEATQEMADLFKVLYIKLKGSNAGLEAYQADIRKGVTDNLHKKLTKNILNQAAPNFTLTDLKGNQITLADMKGKIVILDFWANWCVPCKASFPAMQMAIDQYKNDPDIKFLFIHTWERSTSPVEDARAYINKMKYSFQVLMDTKDPETKANKVVESYGVNSIPAKFVIDEKGNIRFRLTGFNGSKEAAIDEINMMIGMIRTKK